MITWHYSVADDAVVHLAQGQTKVETFTISLFDGASTVTKKTSSSPIAGTNDAPTVTDTNGTTAWAEAAGLGANTAAVIDSGLRLPVDNTTLASAVSMTTGFVSGEDVLGFTANPAGLRQRHRGGLQQRHGRSQPDVSGIDVDAIAVAGGAGRGDLQQLLAQSDRGQPHHQLRGK